MEKQTKPNVRELVLKNGIQFASDEELLMLIIGSGTRYSPVELLAIRALEVIETCSGQNLLLELMDIPGLGPGKALALSAVLELGRRKTEGRCKAIKSPKDLMPYIKKYSERTQEHFLCVSLNGAHELLHIHVVAVGTLNRAIVRPRDVFGEALRQNAAAVILCHNHPSGNCKPSEDDIEATKDLFRAAQLLGIAVLDHLIVSEERYFSFVNNALFDTIQDAIIGA